jgi:Fic family protein
MAKSIIEKAPFKFSELPQNLTQENFNYILKYKETDEQGRYLYWDKFKYRVAKEDDPTFAWWACKWNRLAKMKVIEFYEKNEEDSFAFCVPDILQAQLHKIATLSSQGIVPHNSIKKNYLISSLLMEEAISSSQLEGASTTRRVAKSMLSSGRKPQNEDEVMILNNYLLMQEVKRCREEPLTIDNILDFHKIATRNDQTNGNVAGAFRVSNEIVITDGYETIVHRPPHFEKIEERLQKVCDFANTEHLGEGGAIFIHPVVKAIILHFMIAYEHPFPDGNGRTARGIFYWFMLKSGYDFFEYVSISKLLKDAPSRYGKSFLYTEMDDNDLTYFIFYQVEIIIRAIDELLAYLQKKSQEFEEVSALLSSSKIGQALNFIQKNIVKKAIKNPGRIFTSNEIVVDYDISENTARKYLNELVKFNILASYKNGRRINYIAPSTIREVLNA